MIFTLEYFIGLILIGVVAGFASGLLGVGGGFLIVPFQYFLLEYLGVDPSLAMMISLGTSLAIIIPTATSGTARMITGSGRRLAESAQKYRWTRD